jgi:multidrug efflux pump subunit AcrB
MSEKVSAVARFSAAFIKNYRITTLLFLGILILGFFSYTRFLKIEGFPAVEVPVVFVEGTYFVNDADKVDRELTQPIEQAAAELSEVIEVTSTTTPVGAFIVAQFDENIASADGLELFRNSVESSVTLPEGASIEYRTINAGAFDGKHDLIFSVSGEGTIEELQQVTAEVAEEAAGTSEVASAEVLPLIEEQVNPFTGATSNVQTRFNRVGHRDAAGELLFERAVSIGVIKKPDVGVVDLSDAVKAAVESYSQTGNLEGYSVTYGGDVSVGVLEQLRSLEQNAWLGLISVVLLTILIIDWRASIVAGIFIPLVFAFVILGLYVIGYSLNIISIFSLILVLGMFVDNATVYVDALERAKKEGLKGIPAVIRAINEIGSSIIAGTWTAILVFVPMLFISGVLGKFIILIPVTVILALVLSLFLTFSIVPWLGHLFIRDTHTPSKNRIARFFSAIVVAPTKVVDALGRYTAKFVYAYLSRGWKIALVVIAALMLVGVGGSYAGKLNFSVFPPAKDTDQIVVKIGYPAGTTLAQAEEIAMDVEKILADEIGQELQAVTYYVADDKDAMFIVDLTKVVDRDRTSTDMIAALQDDAAGITGARVVIENASVGPPTDEFQVTVQVLAEDVKLLDRGTADIKKFLTGRQLSDGESVTDVVIDRFDVLNKTDGRRYAQVRAKISDPQKTNLVLELQNDLTAEYTPARLDDLGLRDDAVKVDLGAEGENVDSFKSAGVALLVAMLVMYGLLVLQFNSFTQPLLIFLAIPFSFPALFPGLFATDNALSFFVMLGLISLVGVSVNNTIILVHQANALRAQGKTPREAISVAVGIRFRALLATSVTMVIGLFPLAFSDPFWEPLAFTIIFGLASSVVLVILAFPAFYLITEKIRGIKYRFKRRPAA